jgi:hypothetical protein
MYKYVGKPCLYASNDGTRYDLSATKSREVELSSKDSPPIKVTIYPPDQKILKYLYDLGMSNIEKDDNKQ